MCCILRNFIKFANSKVRYSQGNHRNRFPVFYGECKVEAGWAEQVTREGGPDFKQKAETADLPRL